MPPYLSEISSSIPGIPYLSILPHESPVIETCCSHETDRQRTDLQCGTYLARTYCLLRLVKSAEAQRGGMPQIRERRWKQILRKIKAERRNAQRLLPLQPLLASNPSTWHRFQIDISPHAPVSHQSHQLVQIAPRRADDCENGCVVARHSQFLRCKAQMRGYIKFNYKTFRSP